MLVMYNISLVTKIFLPAVSFNGNNCKLRVSLSFLVWISVIKKKKKREKQIEIVPTEKPSVVHYSINTYRI